MTYSSDFRRKLLSVREKEGLTISQVSARFNVGVASVVRWLKRPEPHRSRYKPATKICRIVLARDVREHPDSYHYERAQRLNVSTQGICDALKRMEITYKKSAASSKGERRRTAHLPPENCDL